MCYSFNRIVITFELLFLTFNHFFASAQSRGFKRKAQSTESTLKSRIESIRGQTTESWRIGPGHAKAGRYSWDRDFTCGLVNRTKSRILEGTPAEITEFPWMVSMFVIHYPRTKKDYAIPRHRCSGAIISDYWILTAKHCLDLYWPGVFYIGFYVGSNYKYERASEHEYAARVAYVDVSFYDTIDLVMVRVRTRIVRQHNPAKDKYTVNKVCLPEPDVVNNKPEDAIFSGYGAIDLFGNEETFVLRKARYVIEPAEECLKRYNFNEDSVCVTTDKHITCYGDSGGPLIQMDGGRAVLIGVISYHGPNSNICDKGFVRFVRVSRFVDWIKNIIENDKPEDWTPEPQPTRKLIPEAPQIPEVDDSQPIEDTLLIEDTFLTPPSSNFLPEQDNYFLPEQDFGKEDSKMTTPKSHCNRLSDKTILIFISMILVFNIFN